MRIAHFSDVHLTVPPFHERRPVLGKRWAGILNYYVGGRRRHFRAAELRIARLLEDIDEVGADHVVCTGDLTQMAWAREFDEVAELFGPRLDAPERFTVIPGNHDRYTRGAARDDRFTWHFGRLAAPEGRYPHVKWLDGGRVALVLLDVARPTSFADSSGWCGPEQRSRLREVLGDPSLARAFVILALHYALLLPDGRPDRPGHGIRDSAALMDVLDHPDARLDLVLHGHMHRPYVVRSARRTFVCAGSATDLQAGGGWLVLDVDPERRRLSIARRAWSVLAERFVEDRRGIPGWDGAPTVEGSPEDALAAVALDRSRGGGAQV